MNLATFSGRRVSEREESGDVAHFAIEARPVTGSVTAINSYLMRDTGT